MHLLNGMKSNLSCCGSFRFLLVVWNLCYLMFFIVFQRPFRPDSLHPSLCTSFRILRIQMKQAKQLQQRQNFLGKELVRNSRHLYDGACLQCGQFSLFLEWNLIIISPMLQFVVFCSDDRWRKASTSSGLEMDSEKWTHNKKTIVTLWHIETTTQMQAQM